eukprot:TRINITY_DN1339_c0_g1_i1.p1 TRINITY_DN1339_c0_g1~~TRINITY_DN1339_c0_g1_i1.p1  ORF type:complete len:436 (-),score=67.13 TRINITY_DN1339_c0_g1_i1:48-1355(-)
MKKFNETFGFMWDLDVINTARGINDRIVMEFHQFRTIGTCVLGRLTEVDLSTLTEGTEKTLMVPIEGTGGTVKLTLMWYTLSKAEAPRPLWSHTGGSLKAHFNSLTRTAVKEAIRRGNRGAVTNVEWLQVKVHQAKDLEMVNKETDSPTDPFFVIYLNSSQSVSYKGPISRNTPSPVYSPPFETGFELVCVVGGQIRDSLVIEFFGHRRISSNIRIGSTSIPLESLEIGTSYTAWYPLSEGKGKVEVTTLRTSKAVSDLPMTGLSLGKRINAMMFYALACLRLKLLEFGLILKIGINCNLGFIETRIGVTIKPTAEDRIALEAQQLAAEAVVEREVNEDDNEEESVRTESLSAFKKFINKFAENLINKFKSVLCEMYQHGLLGTCGISLMAGFPPYGLELGLSIDVEMENVPIGVITNFQTNYNTLLRSGITLSQ